MSARDAARYLGSRAITFGLYTLAIVDASSFDQDRNDWFLITLRLLGSATFFWWAVSRTVQHWHQDQQPTRKGKQ